MAHVDSRFIGLLSPRLEKFKKVKNNLYNFRCPICGDSKKNKNKTRGYLYQVKANTNYKCHNCGASMSFNNFLKKDLLVKILSLMNLLSLLKLPNSRRKSSFLYVLRQNVGENISQTVDSLPKNFTGRKSLQNLSTELNQRLEKMFRRSLEL